jgi:hypothetical protein
VEPEEPYDSTPLATNTTYVRKELVEHYPNEIEDTLDEQKLD